MQKRKLRLDVEELSVESFTPSAEVNGRGTVHGAQQTAGDLTCAGDPTCAGNVPSYCQPQSCDWTQCQNLSCLAGAGCGSGSETLPAQLTCRIQCNPNPGIE